MARIAEPYEGSEVSRAIIGRDIRLVFTFTDDRWSHIVLADRLGVLPHALLASHDDDSEEPTDDSTPVRPVYQQLHFQPTDDGFLALLVGQSGHEHFSASIHFVESEDGTTHIDFDIAGRRTRDPAGAPGLAPTYVVNLPLVAIEEASHRLVRWVGGDPRGHLMIGTVEAEPNATIVLVSEAGRRGSLVQIYTPGEPVAGARRCRYCWTWEAPRDTTTA